MTISYQPLGYLVPALAFFLGTAVAQEPAAEPERVPMNENPVILTVDGTPIMANDVREMMMSRYGQQLSQMPPEQLAMVQQQMQNMILQDLVNTTLLLNAANKQGYETTDEQMQEQLDAISQRVPEGMTLEDFAAQGGVTIDRLKSQIDMGNKIQQLVDEVTKDVAEPDEAEVKKFYDENPEQFAQQEGVQASHILVSTQGVTDEAELAEKLKEAEDIKKQLDEAEGDNFSELAQECSDCPSKAKGGDLGMFGRGMMDPVFEEAAFSQEVGDVGDIVKSSFGYHIIKVTTKSDAKALSFDQVKKDLTASLFEQAKSAKVQEYVGELEGSAKIEQPGMPAPEEAAPEAEVEEIPEEV